MEEKKHFLIGGIIPGILHGIVLLAVPYRVDDWRWWGLLTLLSISSFCSIQYGKHE